MKNSIQKRLFIFVYLYILQGHCKLVEINLHPQCGYFGICPKLQPKRNDVRANARKPKPKGNDVRANDFSLLKTGRY